MEEAIQDLLGLNGALAASLVDWKSGMVLVSGSNSKFDIELASAGNAEVIKAKMATMKSLGLHGGIEDILITLEEQFHIIRVLSKNSDLFLYVALDNKKSNLALARLALKQAEKKL